MRASHILLEHRMRWPPAAQRHPRSEEEAVRQLTELRDRIADGESFGELARAHSDCPSKSDGGDLGRFGRGQMAARFESAAWALAVGEVSGVVHTEFGVHLIKRTE